MEVLPFALDGQDEADASLSTASKQNTPPDHVTPGASDDGIQLCRRVIPLLEVSEDCCSICLDEFDKADPGVPTACGHHYHLQCIMQWAQRSCECPLCFHGLQLEDAELNSLLPFGEYVSPEQQAIGLANMESWELERLLIRLAAAGQRSERRAHRHHRRQASRSEASAPQPIAGAARHGTNRQVERGGASGVAAGTASDDEGDRRPAATPPAYPRSWPSASASAAEGGTERSARGLFGSGSSGSGGMDRGVVASSPRPSSSLKAKFAGLRLRESFKQTTRELKSLFSPSASGNGSRQDHASSGSGSSAMV